jgi:hypothetical protein
VRASRLNSVKRGGFPLAVVCLTLTGVAPAASQDITAPRPSGGLFGATRSEAGERNRLNVLFDVSESVNNELAPEFRSRVAQSDSASGGLSTRLLASADYARTRRRVQLAGTALTAFRYDQRLDQVEAISHSAALGVGVRLPREGSVQIAQTAAYAPFYLYQLFPTGASSAPGESTSASPDYRIDQARSFSYATTGNLAFGSARGTRVTTTAEYRHTDYQRQPATRPDLTTYAAGAKLSRAVSHASSLSIEYQYRTGEFGYGGRAREHRITMGTEYSRAITARRRATFRVDVTPATIEIPESGVISAASSLTPSALETGQLYRLQGEASVDYEFRRNWRAKANVRRGVEYLALLAEPVLSDAARIELTGLVARRVDVSATIGYATGASAIRRGSDQLETRTGQARIRYALSHAVALYSEYRYYYYNLRGQASLAPDLPSAFEQQGVRVGLILFETPGR